MASTWLIYGNCVTPAYSVSGMMTDEELILYIRTDEFRTRCAILRGRLAGGVDLPVSLVAQLLGVPDDFAAASMDEIKRRMDSTAAKGLVSRDARIPAKARRLTHSTRRH